MSAEDPEEALRRYGTPELFNTDQGFTFTNPDYTKIVLDAGVRIRVDGSGRALDNVITEWFWRTLTYAAVYQKDHDSMADARGDVSALL